MEERFQEADITLQKLFELLRRTRHPVTSQSFEGTYEALSILLGPYSAHMLKMVKEDTLFRQRTSLQGNAFVVLGTESDHNIVYYCQGNEC